MTLKARVTTGWNLIRLLYFVVGIALIVQSVLDKNWIVIPLGVYFAASGLFAFGCGGGNCYNGSCNIEKHPKNKTDPTTEFEEIKKT